MKKRIQYLGIGLFLLIILNVTVQSQAKNAKKGTEVFGVSFLKTMFPNASVNDASAAIKVYLNELQKNLIVGYELRTVMFENTEELLKSFSHENFALINLTAVDFLQYKSRLSLTPVMVSYSKDSPLEEFVLLVKNNGKYNSYADLADQKIGMLPRSYNPIPSMWLETLLAKNNVAAREKNFSRFNDGKSESQLIMAVFFGQMSACLVTKNAYDVMTELNPQVGLQLKILAKSPGYVRSVVSFTNKFMKSPFHLNLEDGIKKVVSYPAGRQLFTLMRTDKIVPYKEEYMDGVKKLLSEYKLLQKK